MQIQMISMRKTIKGRGKIAKTIGMKKGVNEENPGDTMLLNIHRKITISVLINIYQAISQTRHNARKVKLHQIIYFVPTSLRWNLSLPLCR